MANYMTSRAHHSQERTLIFEVTKSISLKFILKLATLLSISANIKNSDKYLFLLQIELSSEIFRM